MPVNNPIAVLDEYDRHEHEALYPTTDGEGTAALPTVIITQSNDETNGASTDQDYWGEPMSVVPPATLTAAWAFIGVSIFPTTTGKAVRCNAYRIVNATGTAATGGNAWNEGETVLTVASSAAAAEFVANDLAWISSSAYVPDGEIVKVVSVSSAAVTIARETVAAVGDNTGLRWAHTTNIGAGTLKMYRCYRVADTDEHPSSFDYGAASAREHIVQRWHVPRRMEANDGIIVRSANVDDGGDASFGVSVIEEPI